MRALLLFLISCSGEMKPVLTTTPTSEMSAAIVVAHDGMQTNVDVALTTNGTLVPLQSDVTLTANMQKLMPAMNMHYTTSFATLDPMYTIALARMTGAAPNSNCTMPATFALQGPAAGTFSRTKDDIVVTYMPGQTNDPISWSLVGSCLRAIGEQDVTGDSGSFTIGRGGLDGNGSCMAVLTVFRTRKGTLDPAYGKGGNIACRQQRNVTITSAP